MFEQNMSVHQTVVPLRFTPDSDFCVVKERMLTTLFSFPLDNHGDRKYSRKR
jgi:hypothetical protein